MKYCLDFFKRYVDYKGVSDRKEFWYPILMHFVVYLVLFVIGLFLKNVSAWLSLLYGAGTIVPFTSSAVRRLHDTDRSGLNLFFILIPLVGLIYTGIMLCDKTKYDPYSFEIEKEEGERNEDSKEIKDDEENVEEKVEKNEE